TVGRGPRESDADGVGAEPPVPAAPRRDGRSLVGDIDEMQRHQSRRRAHLAIGADPADMVGIAQRDDRDPVALRPRDAELRRIAGDDLAITTLAVIDEHRAAVGDDAAGLVGDRLTGAEVAEIARDHPDPMAVMALEVGLDQVIADDAGLLLVAPG